MVPVHLRTYTACLSYLPYYLFMYLSVCITSCTVYISVPVHLLHCLSLYPSLCMSKLTASFSVYLPAELLSFCPSVPLIALSL